MNIVEELKKLNKERSEESPFESFLEFEKWADIVQPLLSFNPKYSREFSKAVTNATFHFRMENSSDATTNINNAIGVVNKAIIAAEIEFSNRKNQNKFDLDPNKSSKSIKEKFENHFLVFGFTLLITGFLAGIGTMKFLFPLVFTLQNSSPTPSATQYECNIEGLQSLSGMHDKRIGALQLKLLDFEDKASDKYTISSDQKRFLDSVNRVRADIEVENTAFNQAVNQLNKKCKELHNK